MSLGTTWGTSPAERDLSFPGDYLIERPQAELFRGITVEASPATIFRWLCQLRLGSYSYTSGGKSPRELSDGLDELEAGQRFMGVFGLVDFEQDRHITMRLEFDTSEGRLYGRFLSELIVCYLIVPRDHDCRLLLKYVARYRDGPLGMLARVGLPWGDLIMAREQLMTLRDLAEQT